MVRKEWIINKDTGLKNKSLSERLLFSRGIKTASEIKEFLNPLEMQLTRPGVFCDMQKALKRISKAIDNQENILIYGDFDADGVTSVSLLLRTFMHLKAKVDYFIPDRDREGHGLNSKMLVKLMATKKPKLLITVDCGVSNVEQVQFLKSFKVDVIITDHHEAPEILPQALAIINPKAKNALDDKLCAKEIRHLTSLAGVGVAFKLAQAVLEYYEKTDFIYELLPYTAVGTIADMVPLIGENRYFTSKGLELISKEKHYGLKRLLEVSGSWNDTGITSDKIAFGAAPRINASGRLDTVEDALKVLISDNKQEIELAIMSLENLNKIRQKLCEDTFIEAEEMLKQQENQNNAIILLNSGWHIGIIGIVASKLVEKYYKPVFLMTVSEETKQIRCSSRSVEGVNIYDVLSANAEYFEGFGGHAMAGGFTFDSQKVTFETVKKALDKTVNEITGNKKFLPKLYVDAELEPGEISENLIADIKRLQPFGAENPNPVFVLNNLTLLQKKLMGADKNHLKLVTGDTQNNTYDCIWWQKGDISLKQGDKLDIAFCPQINTYNGNTSIQLILEDVHSDNLIEEKIAEQVQNTPQIKHYDHRKKTDIFTNVEDYVQNSDLKISVFAEDKTVIQSLKPYSALYDKIFNRQTLSKCDTLMFFDYPPSEKVFENIIKKASPKFLHFMKYDVKKIDEKELLKTFSGMLKYSFNNQQGIFDLEKSSIFLALDENTVISMLQIFEEAGLVKILEKRPTDYKIESVEVSDITKTLHTKNYEKFKNLLEKIQEYKTALSEGELINLPSFTP